MSIGVSEDALRRVLAYFEHEAAMGRERVLLTSPLPPVSVHAVGAEPSGAREVEVASSRSGPTARTGGGAAGGAAGGGVGTGGGAPAGGGKGEAAPKTYGPLDNLRSDATVEAVAEALAPIDARAQQCVACRLHETRKTVVFGTGSARAGIIFVGEAPGASEDEQGVPFVGRAGQLLDKILAAIGVAREDVYICNVLKCRPPGNRDPKPDEAAFCAPFLKEQLDALKPRVICALGLHAARRLLEVTTPMGRLRGQVLEYYGIPTIATYHPAALLRNPSLKRAAWEDFQLLRKLAETSSVE